MWRRASPPSAPGAFRADLPLFRLGRPTLLLGALPTMQAISPLRPLALCPPPSALCAHKRSCRAAEIFGSVFVFLACARPGCDRHALCRGGRLTFPAAPCPRAFCLYGRQVHYAAGPGAGAANRQAAIYGAAPGRPGRAVGVGRAVQVGQLRVHGHEQVLFYAARQACPLDAVPPGMCCPQPAQPHARLRGPLFYFAAGLAVPADDRSFGDFLSASLGHFFPCTVSPPASTNTPTPFLFRSPTRGRPTAAAARVPCDRRRRPRGRALRAAAAPAFCWGGPCRHHLDLSHPPPTAVRTRQDTPTYALRGVTNSVFDVYEQHNYLL